MQPEQEKEYMRKVKTYGPIAVILFLTVILIVAFNYADKDKEMIKKRNECLAKGHKQECFK